jgi:hypothetical protein
MRRISREFTGTLNDLRADKVTNDYHPKGNDEIEVEESLSAQASTL